ncbi:MAG: metallophosphoesterase family protein [Pseudomonadota bacterium]
MRTRDLDLGDLSGDLLLFGGPYSNLQATQALFDQTRHIRRENRICTGDLAAYCADPLETAELVLRETAAVVAGNCEIQLTEGAQDCGCGFEEGTACDLASGAWFAHASAKMAPLRSQLSDLPDKVFFRHSGLRCVALHGGVSDVARFIWETDEDNVFQSEINQLGCDIDVVVAGHSGVTFQRQIGNTLWVNAGVIGMPPHDGAPETRFVIASNCGFTVHRLTYDFEQAAARMEATGLVQGYETGLRTGFWPSEDVLPQALRR